VVQAVHKVSLRMDQAEAVSNEDVLLVVREAMMLQTMHHAVVGNPFCESAQALRDRVRNPIPRRMGENSITLDAGSLKTNVEIPRTNNLRQNTESHVEKLVDEKDHLVSCSSQKVPERKITRN
jgi:hypothetical protein